MTGFYSPSKDLVVEALDDLIPTGIIERESLRSYVIGDLNVCMLRDSASANHSQESSKIIYGE